MSLKGLRRECVPLTRYKNFSKKLKCPANSNLKRVWPKNNLINVQVEQLLRTRICFKQLLSVEVPSSIINLFNTNFKHSPNCGLDFSMNYSPVIIIVRQMFELNHVINSAINPSMSSLSSSLDNSTP